MYFHLLSIIFSIIGITLLWYDAIHDATCIPVDVYIMLYVLVKAPLTAPLYEYFAEAQPRQNTSIIVQ